MDRRSERRKREAREKNLARVTRRPLRLLPCGCREIVLTQRGETWACRAWRLGQECPLHAESAETLP